MNKLLHAILNKKYLLIILLTLLISLWFIMPKLGITRFWGRIGLLTLITFISASLILWYKWLMHHRGTLFANDIQTQQGSIAGQQLEIAIFKEKMNEAIQSLKTSKLGIQHRGKAALYALPWFVIIGPSAAGKSTLIRNSGLNFPFNIGEDIAIKGLGGTRNCDWWFSDQAILLDTAGRYTIEEDDQKEWFTFLSILKKHRPRQPINGIITAISLADILTADEAKQRYHIKIIRNRIEELTDQLGFIYPVFLTITKCDLLKGFEAFFNNINEPEREQIWGISTFNNLSDENFEEFFSKQCEELFLRLTSQRLRKLSIEYNSTKKQEIFDFPDQFELALIKIKTFIQSLCRDNPYQKAPKIFGIYFTSSEQTIDSNTYLSFDENNHIQYSTISNLSKQTKSYFIKTLFNEIIFVDHHAIICNQKKQLSTKRLHILSTIFSILVISISFIAFKTVLNNNTQILQQGVYSAHTLARRIQQTDHPFYTLLNTQSFHQALNDKKLLPWYKRLGLYKGKKLSTALNHLISNMMQVYFLHPTASLLENRLLHYNAQWKKANATEKDQLRGIYYTTLKAYLTLGYPSRINLKNSPILLATYWHESEFKSFHEFENKRQQAHQIQKLAELIRIYLVQLSLNHYVQTGIKPWKINTHLVEQSRSQLYELNTAKNLFAELQMKYQTQLFFLSIQDLIRTNNIDWLQNDEPLPAMYTKTAWKNIIAPEIKRITKQIKQGDWVIDGELDSLHYKKMKFIQHRHRYPFNQIQQQLYQEYEKSYYKTWLKFLNSISVKPFSSFEDADKKLAILSNPKGPLAQLLQVINDHLPFHRYDKNKVPLTQPLLNNDQLKDYLNAISSTKSDIQQLATSTNQIEDVQKYTSQMLCKQRSTLKLYRSTRTIETLLNHIDDPDLQTALKNLFLSPIKASWQFIVNQTALNIQNQWKHQVFSVYQKTIHNQFPFSSFKQNADISDTIDFFKPQDGTIWLFVHQQLDPFLKLHQQKWIQKKWLNIGINFSHTFLQSLTQAQHITDTLFDQQSNHLHLTFQLYPKPTPGLRQINLQIGNQIHHYTNGPQQWYTFTWPPNQDTSYSVSLSGITVDGFDTHQISFNNPWSIFYLFKTAHVEPKGQGLYQLTWSVKTANDHNKKISFLLQVHHKNDFIHYILTKPFHLPTHVTQKSSF